MRKSLVFLIFPIILISGCSFLKNSFPATDAGNKTDQKLIEDVKKIVSVLPRLCLDWQKFPQTPGWEKYDGQFFSIFYPANFNITTTTPSPKNSFSVAFAAPDKDGIFSVTALQWGSDSAVLGSDLKATIWNKKIEENLTCETELGQNVEQTTDILLEKFENKYLLTVDIRLTDGSSNTQRVFTYSFTDGKGFLTNKDDFLGFLYSLEQYAD